MKNEMNKKLGFQPSLTSLIKKISAFFLIIIFTSACGENIPHESDMRTIQLEFFDEKTQSKPLRMDIPFSYLRKYWRHIAKNKPQPYKVKPTSQIEIKTIFPELTPHPQKFYQTRKTKQGLYIYMKPYDITTEISARTLKSYKKKYRLKDTNFHGLHRYEVECFKIKCSGDQNFYLISKSVLGGEKTIGKCSKSELNPGGGCGFGGEFRGKRFTYIFRRTELPKWREIEAHVYRLLESFVVDNQKTR